MDKFLSRSIAAAVLLAGCGVFYHYVYYLPGVEAAKERAKAEATAKVEQAKQIVAVKYRECVSTAELNYGAEWATACKSVAAENVRELKNCMATPSITSNQFMGPQWCQKQYGGIDDSPNCSLPNQRAEAVNSDLASAKSQCEREAKLGI